MKLTFEAVRNFFRMPFEKAAIQRERLTDMFLKEADGDLCQVKKAMENVSRRTEGDVLSAYDIVQEIRALRSAAAPAP